MKENKIKNKKTIPVSLYNKETKCRPKKVTFNNAFYNKYFQI